MRLVFRRGKILRVRPGHLANFSGGAGYMPFTIFLTGPVSLLFGLVGAAILFCVDRTDGSADHTDDGCRQRASSRTKALLQAADAEPNRSARTSLCDFAIYARWHLWICGVLTIVMGTLFSLVAFDRIYGSTLRYAPAALLVAVGPFVSWFLSTLLLIRRIDRSGASIGNLAAAGAAHVVMLAACAFLAVICSA